MPDPLRYLTRLRPVFCCLLGRPSMTTAMVREGWASNYARYSKGAYGAVQQEARTRRAGLWQGQFIPHFPDEVLIW